MKRTRLLLLASLFAASCAVQPQSSVTSVHESTKGGSSLSPAELSKISKKIEEIRKNNSSNNYTVAALSEEHKFNHKGIPGNKDITDYTDEELDRAKQDQISIILHNAHEMEKVGGKLEKIGYKVQYLPTDTIITTLPETGKTSLKKHFKILDKLSEARIVTLRIPIELSSYSSPNDTFYMDQQQNMNAINAPQAWTYSAIRNSTKVIGIVDSGMQNSHEDLSDRYITGINSGPTGIFGWGYETNTQDSIGHGTQIAGIAAASPDNGKGIVGSGWGNRLMPIKVTEGEELKVYPDNIRAGVDWAIQRGVRVFNCSLGGRTYDVLFEDMVKYGKQANPPAVFICAAGNTRPSDPIAGNGLDYPARLATSYDNVIAVGSVSTFYSDPTLNLRSGFSFYNSQANNFSQSGLGLMAPGEEIMSPAIPSIAESFGPYTDDPDKTSGTSFAAPFVTGAFASLSSAASAIPYWQIKDILFANTRDIGPNGWDKEHGFGLLNVGNAANYLLGSGIVYGRVAPGGNLAWTNDPSENLGSYSRLAFGLCQANLSGTMRLYRLVQPGTQNRVIVRENEFSLFPEWQLEGSLFGTAGLLGYASITSNGVNTMNKKLYRLYSSYSNSYWITNIPDEYTSLKNQGWKDKTDLGYGDLGYTW